MPLRLIHIPKVSSTISTTRTLNVISAGVVQLIKCITYTLNAINKHIPPNMQRGTLKTIKMIL